MDPAISAPIAAIAGSLVGALGSSIATWIAARHQDRREMLGKQIVRREALYSDFISESVRLLIDAMQHNGNDLHNLLPIYSLISRIRLNSSHSVLHEAEQVINIIVNTYPKPNLTAEEIEYRAMNGEDPLRRFSDICRAELDGLQRQL